MFETSIRLTDEPDQDLERRLEEARKITESLGDPRLMTFLDLIRGDFFAVTDRVDMAQAIYRRSIDRAVQTSDALAEASAREKLAFLEQGRGRTVQAISALHEAADLHSHNERYRAAVSLLEHAHRLAKEGGLDTKVLAERLAEQQRRMANHEIDLISWSKRRSESKADHPAEG
jgi:hypothetical protein